MLFLPLPAQRRPGLVGKAVLKQQLAGKSVREQSGDVFWLTGVVFELISTLKGQESSRKTDVQAIVRSTIDWQATVTYSAADRTGIMSVLRLE